MRSKSYLFLLVVLVLGVVSGIGYATLKYRLGLDIQGGVRFTYQMDTSKLTSADQRARIPAMQDKLVGLMQNRAVGPLGVTEPTVTKKGSDQIVIELPGLSDVAKAQEVMGTSARIEFYWAKNVASPLDANRPYVASEAKDPNEIAVSFNQKFGDQTPIAYSLPDGKQNPRYKAIIDRWDLILAGEDLAKAEGTPQGAGGAYIPLLTFSPQGAKKMEA